VAEIQRKEETKDPPDVSGKVSQELENGGDERLLGDVPEEGDVFFPDFEEYGEEDEMPRYVVSLPDDFLREIGM